MARRRSLNRRWSRRSMNATELDQNSEFFDEDNPVWWKNLPDTSTLRPSTQTSFAETTAPNLTLNSLVNDTELQDRWWDNLDRTSLQSSRRFSARKSVNPEEVAPESFVSEGDEDVSIKKRKVLLRARTKRSVGTENFLKAFEDSDVARSEPAPRKKRKTQSPSRSEADLIDRKIRTRHSRSLADRRNSSFDTSNDTDIVIKARPKAFKKRATQLSSDVYDEILSNMRTSGINTSKNASRVNTPEKTIDSNESGFMGPPITGSHRKRLSSISKKLDMTSDESDNYTGTVKSRRDFRPKSKGNASFNPFDEILSGQLNESAEDVPNKSASSSKTATRMSKSLKQNQSLHVSMRKSEEGEAKKVSASESQLREAERASKQQISSDEEKELHENDRRSVAAVKNDSRVSKRHRRNEEDENEATMDEWNVPETQEIPDDLKKNSTMIEESVIDENSPESQNRDRRSFSVITENVRRTKDATSEWNVPETQEDANLSTGRIKNSTLIEESVEIGKESQNRDRRSSVLKKHPGDSRRHTKDATNEWNVLETQEDSRKSTRSSNNSTMIEESAEIDKLPDSQDRRSSSVLKKHSTISKRRTGDGTIEKIATSEWEVLENTKNSDVSTKRTKKSTMREESVDIDESPKSQEIDRRSFPVSKRNSMFSKRNTKNSTIDEVPETEEDSGKSIVPPKNTSIVGASMEIDKLPESQETDRGSPSVTKNNSRVSKRRTKDATIEEAAAGEWELPETQEDSRMSIRRVKNATVVQESIEADRLPEIHDRNRRSSSVSKKSLRKSKRRTREATIDEATMEDDELPTLAETSPKFMSTLKQDVIDRKRRTDSISSKIQSTEHEKLAEKTRSQLFADWESSGSEEEEPVKSQERSHKDFHNSSLITKSLAVSISRLSDMKSPHSRNNKDFKETTEKGKEKRKTQEKRRSVRSRSRNLVDSAYELPDKERSASPIISASENESINKSLLSNRSTRLSSKKRQETINNARKSVNRSIVDSAADSGESDLKIGSENTTKSRKDLFKENKTISARGIAITSASLQEDYDQKSGLQRSNINLSRKSFREERKANESEKDESRQERQFNESINEANAHQSHKSNLTPSSKSSRLKKQIELRKSAASTNLTQENPSFVENISEAETEIADNETSETNLNRFRTGKRSNNSRNSSIHPNVSRKREESGESISDEESNSMSLNQPSKDKSNARRKNSGRLTASKQRIESDESISEEESNLKSPNHPTDKSRVSRQNSRRVNVSKQRIESDESISEEESNLKSLNQPPKDKTVEGRRTVSHKNVSKQHSKFHSSEMEENAEDNVNPTLDKSANARNPSDKLVQKHAKIGNKSSISNVANIDEDASTSVPSEAIPLAPVLTKLPQNTSSFLSKSNKTRAQKNITDFFPSKFLQRNDNSKTLDSPSSFDKEKLDLVRKEIETKRRQMALLKIEGSSKKKEISSVRQPGNATKINKLRAKENAPKVQAKPPKVVDKAYIVNGQVYKRPKLPRPKAWVTDRLYRYLWKKLEPKYNMRTRIKSEHFVEQLSEVVALTIRRKKYDSYKAEVDALMKEMARLNIIKTRNDFYDFCYDFLPYDFRVKVTPMFLPGNIRNIPYDPATLHTPILPES